MSFDPLDFAPPFADSLGLEFLSEHEGRLTIRAPYAPHLVGDPDSGVVHGGVITAMLDNACGRAVKLALHNDGRTEGAIATLDLRIDYMAPAEPRQDLFADANCYRLTRNVAFVRSSAYTDNIDRPVATAVGTFLLGTPTERSE